MTLILEILLSNTLRGGHTQHFQGTKVEENVQCKQINSPKGKKAVDKTGNGYNQESGARPSPDVCFTPLILSLIHI